MTQDIHEWLGAYVLDALPATERAAFELHLSECPACRIEVVALNESAADLGLAMAEPAPSGMRARVFASIAHIPQEGSLDALNSIQTASPTAQIAPPSSRSAAPLARPLDPGRSTRTESFDLLGWLRRQALPLAAGAMAVLCIVLFNQLSEANRRLAETTARARSMTELLQQSDTRTTTLKPNGPSPGETANARANFIYSATAHRGIFTADGLPPVPADRTYELWLIGAAGPVPAGLVRPDDSGSATFLLNGDIGAAKALGVTVEPARGSPQPTGDVLWLADLG